MESIYTDGTYLRQNPNWHQDDSAWKADHIQALLARNGITEPGSLCEVGCGAGYEVWHLAHRYGCDAWGIDTDPRKGWSALAGPRVHLIEGDMADATALPSTHFDRVVSFTVWEHVRRPVGAQVLVPGQQPGVGAFQEATTR